MWCGILYRQIVCQKTFGHALSRWLDEFWNKGNVAIVDELGAPAVLMYYPLTGELRGRESLKQMIRQFRTAFPDVS